MFCNKVSVQLFPKFSINTKNIFLEREHGHRTQIYYYYSKKSPLFFIQAVKRFGNPSTAALKVSCGIFVHSRWREEFSASRLACVIAQAFASNTPRME